MRCELGLERVITAFTLDCCLAALAVKAEKHVFIPLQAAALVPVSIGTCLHTDGCGFGDVVATLSLGAVSYFFGFDGVTVSQQ